MPQKPETRVEQQNDRSFRVIAYLDGKPVGRYLIGIDPDYDPLQDGFHVASTLFSDLPYNGVARALIEKSVEVIQRMAGELKADLIHDEAFVNPEAMKKLPHLYEEHGYRLDRNGWKATKIYRPE